MGPLNGIFVVEAAASVAGQYAGKLLAGLGAEVVKIEPTEGDPMRRHGPFPGDTPDIERSGLFLHLNTGKHSVVAEHVGLSRETALERLLPRADVLLLDESLVFDLAVDELSARFPRLVVAAVTPFGLTGPYARFRATEIVAFALSGYLSLTGAPGRAPTKTFGSLLGYEAGAQAALAIMAAFTAREAGGYGQVADVSVMEAGTFLLGGVQQNAFFYGDVARRNGTRLLGFPPEHSYPSTIRPCRDGFVHAHSNNRHLDLLASLIPHPRLTDPALLSAMMAHADEIDAIMDDWLATRGRAEIVQQAQELHLPFTEVMTPREVLEVEHYQEREAFVTVSHPGAGSIVQPGAPIRFGLTPWETRPAPVLGSSTALYLHDIPEPAGEPGSPPRAGARPLEGVRVLDFTNAVAGPIATFVLADLGADVIKVEAPRSRPPHAKGTAPALPGTHVPGYNRMMLFNELNRGKRSIALDVATPRGRHLFLELVRSCDIVVQNFAPRVMENLGIGFSQLRVANPAVILVSMPAFGLDGPYRDRISYGPGIDAMSGLSHLTGHADGPPMKPGNFFCDQNAGVHAAFAALAALWYRRRSGEGQHVELAMIEGEFQVMAEAYLDVIMNDRDPMRSGNDHPWMAPHDVFPCRGHDQWVAIAVTSDREWRSLCRVIGTPGLGADARFATRKTRHAKRALLRGPISAWTRHRTPYQAQEALQAAGVPAGAVLDVGQLLRDPHVAARNAMPFVDVPGVGRTPYPRVAFTLSDSPVTPSSPAPGYSAHAREIAALAGCDDAAYESLVRDRVIFESPPGAN